MVRKSAGKPRRERILDAAEKLFARRGFYGVSLRDITQAAGVDVALVGYHFGGKRALFDAVFGRRAEVLNRERLELLNDIRLQARPGTPSVEAIVHAFTYPLLERSARGGAGWKSYFALIAYVNNSPEFGPELMSQHFDPLVTKFISVLREALPDVPPQEIYWGYQFLTGALTLTFAETGRIDKLSGTLVRAADLDSVLERLPPYVAGGFRALAARVAAATSPRASKRAATRSRKAAPVKGTSGPTGTQNLES